MVPQSSGSRVGRVGGMFLCLALSYPLSFGPAFPVVADGMLKGRPSSLTQVALRFYEPCIILWDRSPAYGWYMDAWQRLMQLSSGNAPRP